MLLQWKIVQKCVSPGTLLAYTRTTKWLSCVFSGIVVRRGKEKSNNYAVNLCVRLSYHNFFLLLSDIINADAQAQRLIRTE